MWNFLYPGGRVEVGIGIRVERWLSLQRGVVIRFIFEGKSRLGERTYRVVSSEPKYRIAVGGTLESGLA